MGKPRLIILIRHAQSEGNKNRDIHQLIPDHRVKLTPEGWQQAEEAGRRLRTLLKPDDTVRVFTSPYRRTRETTEGVLRSLTESTEEAGPSPFSRSAIKVYEEPRLREQDFGNFQPCSAEMERMWQERADYGHFFYRIPDGESAADAYDRVSGFNESLWRAFGEDDFPSVCVLVTHGLMTRVFLMKWYHWSVEYFEDLRNINHCEFVIMKQNKDNGKYILENKLRTWSELKRKAAIKDKSKETQQSQTHSPAIPTRQWGGCVRGCNHDHSSYPIRSRKATETGDSKPPSRSQKVIEPGDQDRPIPKPSVSFDDLSKAPAELPSPRRDVSHTRDTSQTSLSALTHSHKTLNNLFLPRRPSNLHQGRDGGGSLSGAATPADGLSGAATPADGLSDEDGEVASPSYFPREVATAASAAVAGTKRPPQRRPTITELENWAKESGMGTGARADALGDDPEEEEEEDPDADDEGGAKVDDGAEGLKIVQAAEEKDKSLRGSVY